MADNKFFQFISPEVNYDFVGFRYKFLMTSGIALLVSFVLIGIRGLNFGLDFRGGTEVQLEFKACPPGKKAKNCVPADKLKVNTVRDKLNDAFPGSKLVVQQTGSQGTGFLLKFSKISALTRADRKVIEQNTKDAFGKILVSAVVRKEGGNKIDVVFTRQLTDIVKKKAAAKTKSTKSGKSAPLNIKAGANTDWKKKVQEMLRKLRQKNKNLKVITPRPTVPGKPTSPTFPRMVVPRTVPRPTAPAPKRTAPAKRPAAPAKREAAKPAKREAAKPAKREAAKPAKREAAKPAKREAAKPAKREAAKPAKRDAKKAPAKREAAPAARQKPVFFESFAPAAPRPAARRAPANRPAAARKAPAKRDAKPKARGGFNNLKGSDPTKVGNKAKSTSSTSKGKKGDGQDVVTLRKVDIGKIKAIKLETQRIRELFKALGLGEVKISKASRQRDNRFEYTVTFEGLTAKLQSKLDEIFGEGSFKILQVESVGPSVGDKLRADGITSIILANLFILIYISIRFDFRYAPGAVAALLHDVFITTGVFSALYLPFDLAIIAALLTIIGYSLNDTIVVYDRIRENWQKSRVNFADVMNRSINETLSRTLLTSITTFVAVVPIYIIGGDNIKWFAFAMMFGILIGTYSSIAIASPLVYFLDDYFNRQQKEEDKEAEDKRERRRRRRAGLTERPKEA